MAKRASSTEDGRKVFLLSPARTDGKRAEILLRDEADFELALRLRAGAGAGVTLGEVFSFMSGLYFRGKLSYSNYFTDRSAPVVSSYVITSSAGLMIPETVVDTKTIKGFSAVSIDLAEERYVAPLRRSIEEMLSILPDDYKVVLLGSIATGKYVDLLLQYLDKRLLFPTDFIGRGDMSRGGLLLRAVRNRTELHYSPVTEFKHRRGKRPEKLKPIRTSRAKIQPPT